KKFSKIVKKDIEEFALEIVKAGSAKELIREIKDTPRRQMENELNELVLSGDKQVTAKLKAMKPARLEQFCVLNGIDVVRKAKGGLDKDKTQPNILKRIDELREYIKLSKA